MKAITGKKIERTDINPAPAVSVVAMTLLPIPAVVAVEAARVPANPAAMVVWPAYTHYNRRRNTSGNSGLLYSRG